MVAQTAHLGRSWRGRRIQPSNALWRVFCCGHANALGRGGKGLQSPAMALHFWPRLLPVAEWRLQVVSEGWYGTGTIQADDEGTRALAGW